MAAQSATDAERAASERSASLCPECDRTSGQDHAPDCVLRPVLHYADYLRWLRANSPERYWGGNQEYLTND